MSNNKIKTRNIGDAILTGEVSPCVWMYGAARQRLRGV